MPHFFAKNLDFLGESRECDSCESIIDSPSRAESPLFNSPSLASGDSTLSPSLAEGDKGGGLCKSSDSHSNFGAICGTFFDFLFEAKNVRDDSYLILAQNRTDSRQKVMLIRQKKGENVLVKFNKHFKVQSREAIKNALKDYANLVSAEIIAHNLNQSKREAKSQYLLDSREILELLGECNADSHNFTHPPTPSAREGESLVDSRFKNTPKFLEIGFGSGRHILNLAQNHKDSLIIGLEIYRPAILQVLRQIELLNLNNLFVASIDARVLFEVIPRESLNAIFLHFPVPWEKNPQRRVFGKFFLTNALRALDSQDGRFELITDSKEYFDFAKKLARIYRTKTTINPQNSVISKYEARWRKLQKHIYKLEIFPQFNAVYGAIFALCSALARFTPRFTQGNKKTPKSQNYANLSLDSSKIRAFLGKKIQKKEYFLQVKDIYEFESGFVIYAVFGAYYAPSSAFIIANQGKCEILGNIIPTSANLGALSEILE